MRRLVTRTGQWLIDVAVLTAAIWLAFLLRFDWSPPLQVLKQAAFVWPYVVALQYLLLAGFGVPRFAWRFTGLRETSRILGAIGGAAAILLAVRLGAGWLSSALPQAQYLHLPLGVVALDLLLAFFGITAVRVARRIVGERMDGGRPGTRRKDRVPTLLIGAGQAGHLVARELDLRPESGMQAVGFIDDDRMKVGRLVHGVRVLGTTAQLADVAARLGVEQAVITIANAPRKELRRILTACADAGLQTKVVPGLFEIVGGRVNLSRLRDVAIADLLGRDPVTLDDASIAGLVEGQVVLVTGAGGSIGSELCRQLLRYRPRALVLVEQAENALFEIHRELVGSTGGPEGLHPRIADVTDAARMEAIFDEFSPDAVFHAAAHKHVPMMEWNPGEGVKNNVFGTRVVADLAHKKHVDVFVIISTDKAVNPTSVMGATKRAAEIYVQALSQVSRTRFVAVRFGNVLGSAGSVIPIFKEQIARGGPVTVTHPEMRRYFMTIPEACQLVLQAGSMGEGGEIFVLDMGEPVYIADLARDLIRLSGYTPGEDIEVRFTGLRPGEKLFEELSVADEKADRTRHPKIFVGKIRPHDMEYVLKEHKILLSATDVGDPAAVRWTLARLVPEYTWDARERQDPAAEVVAA